MVKYLFKSYSNFNFLFKELFMKVLSLFSGCGGMDIGFEGGFIAHKKSFSPSSEWIDHIIDDEWVYLKKNRFTTVFYCYRKQWKVLLLYNQHQQSGCSYFILFWRQAK